MRLLPLCMALGLALTICSCGKNPEKQKPETTVKSTASNATLAATLVGKWKPTQDSSLTAELITINADGTLVADLDGGEIAKSRWRVDGNEVFEIYDVTTGPSDMASKSKVISFKPDEIVILPPESEHADKTTLKRVK